MGRNRSEYSLPLRIVFGIGKLIDIILLLTLIAIAVRGLLFLSPALNESIVAEYLTTALEPGKALVQSVFDLVDVEPILGDVDVYQWSPE